MNNVTLTLNISADDRARLDKIIELLTPVTYNLNLGADFLGKTLHRNKPAEPAPTPIEEAPKEEATITPEQIQQKVIQLCATGTKKDKTREIVNAYAPKVSAIPEDKRAEVWEKLLTLEAEA